MTPETEIKHQVKLALTHVPGAFVYYNLQGIGAYKGIPDMVVVKDGKYYGLEIKTPTGRLSEHQERFKEEVESAGGVYAVIRSPEEVLDLFGVKWR